MLKTYVPMDAGPARGDRGCRPVAVQFSRELRHRPVDLGRRRLRHALGGSETHPVLAEFQAREFLR